MKTKINLSLAWKKRVSDHISYAFIHQFWQEESRNFGGFCAKGQLISERGSIKHIKAYYYMY